MKLIAAIFLFVFSPLFVLPAQTIDLDGVEAGDEFRTGVMLFNSGYYNQAYMRFEKALSIKPENRLYRFWLGRSLLQNGYYSAAREVWMRLIQEGYKADFLQSRVDFLSRIYYSSDEPYQKRNYVISHTLFQNTDRGRLLFSAPMSVSADSYGGLWVPSFSTSEVLRFNANGREIARIKSGYRGFNKPFDVLPTDNPNVFWLTEFGGDRVVKVDRFGKETASFGGKGRADDRFLGPQFLAQDKDGFLYVTDAGNKKVSKWTADGEFVLAFGKSVYPFPGFSMPSGIAVSEETVYVADQRAKAVYTFDRSGNYIETLTDARLKGPEGLFNRNDTELIVADGQMIKLKGHGEKGSNGAPDGDLYITFQIAPDPEFKREGDDLFTDVDIDLYTAVLGGSVNVKTIDGMVKLKVNPGTQNDTKVRLRGKGFPVYKKEGTFGDLIVTYHVNIPTSLSEKQKELFTQLKNS